MRQINNKAQKIIDMLDEGVDVNVSGVTLETEQVVVDTGDIIDLLADIKDTDGIKKIVDPLPAGTNLIGAIEVADSVLPAGAATETKQNLIIDKLSDLYKNVQFMMNDKNKLIFGVSWDKGSDPTLTRTDAADGLVANVGVDNEVVKNDFDGMPIFGEMVKVEDALGNHFVRIPKTYLRKAKGDSYRLWQASKLQYPGFYLPWCFWDFTNKKELDYIDVGCYKGYIDGNGDLCSIPNIAPTTNKTIVQIRNAAQANGKKALGYQQLDIHVVDLIRTLMFIEFGTLDIQTLMAGYTDGYYGKDHEALIETVDDNYIVVANAHGALYEAGQTVSISTSNKAQSDLPNIAYGVTVENIEIDEPSAGQTKISFSGEPVSIAVGDFIQNSPFVNGFSQNIASSSGSIVSNASGKFPCVWRNIESPFGDMWQFVDGLNINKDHQTWVCLDADKYQSNQFAVQYYPLGYSNAISNNYVKEMGLDPKFPFAELPVSVVSNGQTIYYSDYYYQASSTNYIARFGGRWNTGAFAGLSSWTLNVTSSAANLNYGGRLLKKPL